VIPRPIVPKPAVSRAWNPINWAVGALAVTGIEFLRDRRWTIPACEAMTVGGRQQGVVRS
jgi:hypothetical protein